MKKPKTTKKYIKKKRTIKKAPISKGANKLIPTMSNAPELKFIRYAVSTDTRINNAGSLVLLNGVSQGTTDSTRIGDKIMMKSLLIRLRMYQPRADSAIVRYIIFLDTQANGTLPAIVDVLDYFGTPSQYSALSYKNSANLRRFIVLKDKCIAMNNSNGADVSHEHCEDIYLKLNCGTDYGHGGGATYSSISTNGLWILFCADKANAATNSYYQFTSQVRFADD